MDYKNSKIYKIVDIGYTKMYIGSTTQSLSKRFSYHKKAYIRWKNNKHNKVMVFDIFDEFGINNCKIELIEECLCENRMELCKKEGEYIQNNNCVNKYIAGRTNQEYYETNRDKIREQHKKYRETNRDKIAEYHIEYQQFNKDKISEYNKEYFQTNKDKKKEYYKANKDKIAEKRKKYLETNRDKINARRRELHAIKKANKEIIIE
jgi:hypothetical protein